MSKNSHILCVSAGHDEGQYAPELGFKTVRGAISNEITGDLWVGPRPRLEAMKPQKDDAIGAAVRLLAGGASIGDLFKSRTMKEMFSQIGSGGAPDLAAALDAIYSGPAPKSRLAYPTHLQIIPYYLFRNRGRYFNYLRPDTGNEARLHGKISIGVGGHVDLLDVVATDDGRIDLQGTLEKAGRREAAEEIGVQISGDAFRFIGVLYAVDQEVDTVHLGIVGVCDLTDAQAEALKPNDEVAQPGFRTLAAIRDETAADPTKTLETWTRLVIESNPLA